MSYEALYRRWRPKDFDTLIGQDTVKQALSNALASGHIAHAYLFAGPRGTGKTSTARILAKALNCDKGPTVHPCGECQNCLSIAEGSSMDVLEIDAASNRGIDNIKELRDRIAFVPVDGRYKVYVIDEVHMLTTEAFNALLKTLEEPPDNVVFILATTDPHKVPATIHSRCQRFDFHRVTVDDITQHLVMVAKGSDIVADKEALRLIAIQAEGGMRDALSLLDQCAVMSPRVTVDSVRDTLGIVGREALRELVTAIGNYDAAKTIEITHKLLVQGREAVRILTELTEYLRALLLFKTIPEDEEIYLVDDKEALAANAELFSTQRILSATEQIAKGMNNVKNSLNPRIFLELALLQLCSRDEMPVRVEKQNFQP
ncbi:MAG: DNA polymerase III subunit gamma/tau, partial [Acidaminococcaceae bacterium]|nr:DNA polymerase III subunit gamma/tau [Acidaminococcaceae bacterium]